MLTIESMRPDKTYFGHLLFTNEYKVTLSVSLVNREEGTLAVGIAFCSPLDQFCKKLGRTISQGRKRINPIVIKCSPSDHPIHAALAALDPKINPRVPQAFLQENLVALPNECRITRG